MRLVGGGDSGRKMLTVDVIQTGASGPVIVCGIPAVFVGKKTNKHGDLSVTHRRYRWRVLPASTFAGFQQ